MRTPHPQSNGPFPQQHPGSGRWSPLSKLESGLVSTPHPQLLLGLSSGKTSPAWLALRPGCSSCFSNWFILVPVASLPVQLPPLRSPHPPTPPCVCLSPCASAALSSISALCPRLWLPGCLSSTEGSCPGRKADTQVWPLNLEEDRVSSQH